MDEMQEQVFQDVAYDSDATEEVEFDAVSQAYAGNPLALPVDAAALRKLQVKETVLRDLACVWVEKLSSAPLLEKAIALPMETRSRTGWAMFLRTSHHGAVVPTTLVKRSRGHIRRIALFVPRAIEPNDEFRLSARTVSLVRSGWALHAGLQGTGARDDAERQRMSDDAIIERIDEALRLTLIGIADALMQYGDTVHNPVRLADKTGFVDFFDALLLSRVPIVPKEAPEFSWRLTADLLLFLKSGGKMDGDWGSLAHSGDSIFLALKGEKSAVPPRGRRPVVLE